MPRKPHTLIPRDRKQAHGSAGFRIEILYPGHFTGGSDSGIGTLGRIDDARVAPGHIVKMHPHRDDEILTYLRSGMLEHRDTVGVPEAVTSTRLMLMNAGAEFQHEERVVAEGGPLRALQIFLRPESPGLEPRVQFHDFGTATTDGEWRLIAGPKGDAPLEVRSRAWVEDARFNAGTEYQLSEPYSTGLTRMLYVFGGSIELDGRRLAAGDAAILSGEDASFSVEERAELVLFSTDEAAPVFKGGMFSGNRLSA
jgi:hypothetical protein